MHMQSEFDDALMNDMNEIDGDASEVETDDAEEEVEVDDADDDEDDDEESAGFEDDTR